MKEAVIIGAGAALTAALLGLSVPLWWCFILGLCTGVVVAIVRDVVK